MKIFTQTYDFVKTKRIFRGFFTRIILVLLCFPGWASEQELGGTEMDGQTDQSYQMISQVIIDIENAPVTHTSYKDLAEAVIGIHSGEPFSVDRVQRAIDDLKISNRFSHIYSDISESDKHVTLYFRLTPFPLIKEVHIHGAFPFFKTDILHVMTVAVGQPFKSEGLTDQETGIKAYLKKEGFPSAKVHISPEKDPDDGNIILHVYVEKGPELTVEKVIYKGNRNVSSFWLDTKIKSDPTILDILFSKRFIESKLKKDIQSLTQYYRKKGFADCQIQYQTQISESHRVTIIFTVEEGPLYEIRFEGNDTLSARKLKKDIPLFELGNRNNIGLRRTESKIRERYRAIGFLKPRVQTEDQLLTKKGQNVREVTFVINEGPPRTEIISVVISGNHAIKTEAIQKQMLTEKSGTFRKHYFNPAVLADDIDAIRGLYRKDGFLDIDIRSSLDRSEDGRNVSVQLDIDENVRTLVSDIRLSGLNKIPEKEIYQVIQLKPGAPFRDYMVQSDQNAISAFISEKGYPYVTVTGTYQLSDDQRNAILHYDIVQGQQVYMGKIYFTGNFLTKEKTMRKQITQLPGDPFSLEKLLVSQKNLRDMNVFNSVAFDPIGLKEKREDITLLVGVEERKPYYVEFGVGYETQKGGYIHSKIADRNLLGKNQEAWLSGEYSQIGHRLESGLVNPRFWGTGIAMKSTLFWEKTKKFNQDFGISIIGANVGFGKKLFDHVTTGIIFQFERRTQFDNQITGALDDTADTSQTEPRTVFSATPSIIYDARDSFIQPRKGFLSNMSIDISKGVDRTLDDFIRGQATLSYFMTPIDRLTIAWIGRVGYLEPYGSDNAVPQDQLFFLGGGADVRGFDENLLARDAFGNPLGGQTAVSSSIELRIDLGNHFELPLFFDTGKVSKIPNGEADSPFRSSIGTGLRYITPIGPIGLLYGKNLDPQTGEPSGRWHFSIGYTF